MRLSTMFLIVGCLACAALAAASGDWGEFRGFVMACLGWSMVLLHERREVK